MRQCVLTALILILTGNAYGGENLLRNPGFEEGTEHESLEGWESWGRVFHEAVTPNAGHWSAKLFGNFTGDMNHSGMQQDLPAEAGTAYKGTIQIRHNADDQLTGSNKAWLRIEFRDANGNRISESDSLPFTADARLGAYQQLEVGPATAPAGTVSLRFVLLFEQIADHAGAIFCDDAVLEATPSPNA